MKCSRTFRWGDVDAAMACEMLSATIQGMVQRPSTMLHVYVSVYEEESSVGVVEKDHR